uniref:Uncharacterized protein n=2 Tax=Strongyloides stercoralis TaxID=6248 RepID=A0A0K0EPE6_STRER
MEAVVEGIRGCCSIGAEPKTCKLFFGRNSFRINACFDSETSIAVLEAVALLELNERPNLKHGRFFLFGGIHSDLMLVTIVTPEAVVQLELNLKHRNSSERN